MFVDHVRTGRALPVSEEDMFEVTAACLAVHESLRTGEPHAMDQHHLA